MPRPRPLLFVDVDGPLNPFEATEEAAEAGGYVLHRMKPPTWIEQWEGVPVEDVVELPVRLRPEHGAELLALPYELVWCTTWVSDAPEWIAPHLGLPPMPWVPFENPFETPDDGTYWKTHDAVRYADGRPFAWIDDQLTERDADYVAAHHPAPALLRHVSPQIGLTEADFAALRAWASGLPA